MCFSGLKSATNKCVYLFFDWTFIFRTFRIWTSNLVVEDCQLHVDLLPILKHPSLNSFLHFSPARTVICMLLPMVTPFAEITAILETRLKVISVSLIALLSFRIVCCSNW